MIIGTEAAFRAPPDGHTLLFISNGFTTNPAVRSKLPYDTVKDFSGVARMATSPYIIVVHPSVPVKSLGELTALARARPGDLNYATLGPSSGQNIAMLTMTQPAKLKLVEVPFPGIAPMMMAAVGGHVAIAVTNLPDAIPYIDAGRLRPLALTSPKRSPVAPNVPTIAESGYAGYDVQLWMGAAMARAAPREAINRLGSEIVRALEQREVHEALTKVGFNPAPLDPEKFDAFIQTELVRNAKVAREANIRID
jgi:tripartite-type tricarboxylate transporter receptor subunit TctC